LNHPVYLSFYQTLQYGDYNDSHDMTKSTVILFPFLFKHAMDKIDYRFDMAF